MAQVDKLFQLPASPPRPGYSARSELGAPSSVRASQPRSVPIKVSIFPSPTLPRNGQAQSLGKGELVPTRENPDNEHQGAHPPPRPGAQAIQILQRIGNSTPSLPSNGPRMERGERIHTIFISQTQPYHATGKPSHSARADRLQHAEDRDLGSQTEA